MKSEVKVAVLLAFVVILVLGLLWGDHRSAARRDQPDQTIGTVGAGVTVSRPVTESTPPSNPFQIDPEAPAGVPPVVPPPVNVANGTAADDSVAVLPMTSRDTVPGPSLRAVPPSQTPAPVATPILAGSTVINRSDDAMHPVQRGETMRSITVKYYGSDKLAEALQQYNITKLGPSGRLREGVTIRIPRREELAAMASEGRITTPAPAPVITTGSTGGSPSTAVVAVPPATEADPARVYTVKAGDTPMSISRTALGTTRRWKDIMKLNPGLREDNLKIGMKIKLPAKPAAETTVRN